MFTAYQEMQIQEAEKMVERVDELLAVVRMRERGDDGWHLAWRSYLTQWVSRFGMYSMPYGEKSILER